MATIWGPQGYIVVIGGFEVWPRSGDHRDI